MTERIIITSALPYVNNIPHLGNIIGCVLPADVIARYYRNKGKNVLYVCGTDDYGTATEVKAREMNVKPKELCNEYHAKHKAIYKWFNIQFDIFGRTATQDGNSSNHYHTIVSQEIFSSLYKNNYLEEREVTQLYCPSIKRFVSDRFVVGTCPNCGDDEARGDQCDKCRAVYESSELIHPHLLDEDTAVLEPRLSKHLFLRLDLLQPQIEAWFHTVKHKWAANAVAVTEDWLKRGLKSRCITRDMEWGTPLPYDVKLEGKETKVMYNWFDAPIGYISIGSIDGWEDAWTDPSTRLIQFMGVDNVPFHSILFPGSLLGTKENYTLVSEIASIPYLNYKGGKFSKSEGRGIFCDEVMKMGIPPDYWRYYLMKIRPEDEIGPEGKQRSTANFTLVDFVTTCNADLANNIGNLIQRVFKFTSNYFGGTVGDYLVEEHLVKRATKFEAKITRAYETNRVSEVIRLVLKLSTMTNKYLSDKAPWILYRQNRLNPMIACIIGTALKVVVSIITILQPIIPSTADSALSYVNCDKDSITIKPGFTVLFPVIQC